MGDRKERARAWRGVGVGALCGLVAALSTAALLFLIPTEGENPRAWGIIVCGVVTALVCERFALRNWRLLRHYRGDDLAPGRTEHAPPRRLTVRALHLGPLHRHPLHREPLHRHPLHR